MPENWLTNEAISNYIVFGAGIIVAVIGFIVREQMTKKRPSIVIVQKEREASLLDIAPSARGFLQVTYDNQPVSEFYQTTFNIVNSGEQPLQNMEVSLSFENSSDTISFVLDRPTASSGKQTDVDVKQHAVTLNLPYLNPFKEYGDYERLELYSTKPILGIDVSGSGIGWSVKYEDKVKYRAEIETLIASTNSLGELLLNLAAITFKTITR
jgi:hypothetical protein